MRCRRARATYAWPPGSRPAAGAAPTGDGRAARPIASSCRRATPRPSSWRSPGVPLEPVVREAGVEQAVEGRLLLREAGVDEERVDQRRRVLQRRRVVALLERRRRLLGREDRRA